MLNQAALLIIEIITVVIIRSQRGAPMAHRQT
ncbi:leader peptide IlvL [Shewanella psychropiezotolerans]|uniref:Leader peptide IlvL n=1 Tax=Shewanella psychropiezotolerans TaxID=2593655 RepID=A0ABX5X9M1_9GAMM|nr:leader peptide IlvL [Shewanella sp. YLB-07]QDO85971.1 leader peptide IlvL [Shewanella psychropiezotolerans]